jgi:hypothetical protein
MAYSLRSRVKQVAKKHRWSYFKALNRVSIVALERFITEERPMERAVQYLLEQQEGDSICVGPQAKPAKRRSKNWRGNLQ